MAAAYGIIAAPNLSSLSESPTAASDLDRLGGTIADPNLLAALPSRPALVHAANSAAGINTPRELPILRTVVLTAMTSKNNNNDSV